MFYSDCPLCGESARAQEICPNCGMYLLKEAEFDGPYEVSNTTDMPLYDQIKHECNHWRIDCKDGSAHFGVTKEECIRNAGFWMANH